MLPQFIIIGAEKSGSTFLVHRLMEHPGIYMPSLNQTLFLPEPIYNSNLEPLERLFANAPADKIRGIRRGRYLGLPQAPAFLETNIPDGRLIVILRHPVARAVSAYFQSMWFGTMPIQPLNTGLARLLDNPDAHPHAWHSVIQVGMYHKNVSRFLERLSREQLLILLLDDFKNNPAEELDKVAHHIGVVEPFPLTSHHRSANAGVYSLTRVHVRRYYRKFMYELSPEGMQVRMGNHSVYTRAMATSLRRIDQYLLSPFLDKPMPALNASLAQRLVEFYCPEVEQLERLLGRNLSAWKQWNK